MPPRDRNSLSPPQATDGSVVLITSDLTCKHCFLNFPTPEAYESAGTHTKLELKRKEKKRKKKKKKKEKAFLLKPVILEGIHCFEFT